MAGTLPTTDPSVAVDEESRNWGTCSWLAVSAAAAEQFQTHSSYMMLTPVYTVLVQVTTGSHAGCARIMYPRATARQASTFTAVRR